MEIKNKHLQGILSKWSTFTKPPQPLTKFKSAYTTHKQVFKIIWWARNKEHTNPVRTTHKSQTIKLKTKKWYYLLNQKHCLTSKTRSDYAKLFLSLCGFMEYIYGAQNHKNCCECCTVCIEQMFLQRVEDYVSNTPESVSHIFAGWHWISQEFYTNTYFRSAI